MPNGAKSSTGIGDFFFFESQGGETTTAGSRSALAWFEGCVSCCWHDFSTATAGVESQGMTCSASAGCEISIVISIMRQLFSSFCPRSSVSAAIAACGNAAMAFVIRS